MSWLTSLFSNGAAQLVDSIGKAADSLITNDEERLQMKNALAKLVHKNNEEQLKHLAAYDKEISSRHKTDMASDSWLSKNIRPLTLAFMTFAVMGLAYLTIFVLDMDRAEMVKPWLGMFTVLLGTIYAFYFGGRSIEKFKKKV